MYKYLLAGLVIGAALSVGGVAYAAFAPISVPAGGTGQTTFTASQLLYGNGGAALSSVATSSETCTSPLSCTAYTVVGSGGGAITLSTAGTWSGNAGTATAFANGRTIAITGDLAYTSGSFDGTGNVTGAGTLATVNSNVGSFTNANITVNAKGLITAASSGSAGGSSFGYPFIGNATSTTLAFTNGLISSASSTFVTAPTFSSLTGVLKGNGSSAITVAANGTDYTLITALTCGGTDKFSGVTASGVFTCSADSVSAGGAGSGTVATSTALVSGQVDFSTSANQIGNSGNFLWDNANNKFTVIGNASTTQFSASLIYATTSINTPAIANLTGNGFVKTSGGNGTLSVDTTTYVSGVTGSYPIVSSGGATPNITFSGLATTSPWTTSNLAYVVNGNTLTSVATGTVSAGSSAITVTAGRSVIGGALAIDCATATSGQNGCLSSTDWSTFNNKQATISATWPIILSGAALSFGWATTSQPSSSNLFVSNGTNGFYGVATSSETCSTGVTCSAHTVLSGGGAITLATINAGVLGAQTNSTVPTSQATSTLYGNGTAGQVLGWTNGALGFVATSSTFSILTAVNATTTGTFAMPVSATLSTPVAGTIGIDTTSGQLRYSDVTGTTRVLSPLRDMGFAYATTTWGANATTTIRIGPAPANITVSGAYCETNTGTVGVSVTDATPNRLDYIRTASTTINKFNYTTNNNSFTAGESIRVDLGTPASSPTSVSCRLLYTFDAD